MITSQPVHLRITLPFAISFIVMGGVFISFRTHDPHWLNRSGALIAAVAAGGILLQIKAEMQLEAKRGIVEKKIENVTQGTLVSMPVEDLEARLTANRLELQMANLSRQRLVVAAFVVGGAILGELLHGFGDLLMCYGLGVCVSH